MKKTIHLFMVLFALLSMRGLAQSPYCLAAGKLTPVPKLAGTDIDTIISGLQTEKWFKFPAIKQEVSVNLNAYLAGLGYRVNKIELYKGSCASLTFLAKDSLSSTADSVLVTQAGSLASTDTLFVRTTCIANSYCSGCGNTNIQFRFQVNFVDDAFWCTTCNTMTGCNLVCNGDFEQHNSLGVASGHSNLQDACGWTNANDGTADYFNAIVPSGGLSQTSVPCNEFGYQVAHSGQGYAGFLAEPGTINQSTFYEYIQTKLLAPLIINQTYTVTFWLSQGEASQLANNTIGVYFSSSPTNVAGTNMINSPAFTINPYSLGLTMNGWTQCTSTYTPNSSGIQYMFIGAATTVFTANACQLNANPSCTSYGCQYFSYFYIDDISVTGPTVIATHNLHGCPGKINTVTTILNTPLNWYMQMAFNGTWSMLTQHTQTVNLSGPGTFMAVSTDANGCAVAEMFIVASDMSPDETIHISPSPVQICSPNTTLTLTASGLSSGAYTWYPHTGLPPALSTTPVYTYTSGVSDPSGLFITGQAANGCITTLTVPVSVISPPTATINTSGYSMCSSAGNTSTYTATPQGGAYTTYTWSVTVGGTSVPFTTAPNGQSITVNWSSYTGSTTNAQVCLTVSYPSSGCSASACIDIAPCCVPSSEYILFAGNTDPANPTPLTSTSFTTGNSYALSGYYVISGSTLVSWATNRFSMAPGTKITVPANTALKLSECHFFACNKMWDGIYSTGGAILFAKRNLFEDAVNAIVIQSNGTPVPSIYDVYFNKCRIGIDFRTNTSIDTIQVRSCKFTSRNFGINTAGTNINSTLLGNGTTSIPYNYPTANYTHYPSTTMLAPYAGFRAQIGVNIADNVQVTIGKADTLKADRNIFDNLFYGIHGTNSNVYVLNNHFIYIQEHCNGSQGGCREPASIDCPAGTAICTANTTATQSSPPKFTNVGRPSSGSVMYPNTFESDQYGIYNKTNRSLDARYNNFKRIDQVGIYSGLCSNYGGTFPNNYPSNLINVLNNVMDSAQTGVYLNDNRNAVMNVLSNEFNWAGYIAGANTQRSISGIVVDNAVVHTTGSLNIRDNRAANLQKGITLTLQGYNGTGTTNRVQVLRNSVVFNQLQTTTVSVQHYGIGVFSCKRVTVDGDNTASMILRTITSPATPASLNIATQREFFSSVRIESSIKTWVTDMNITQIPVGIYAKGACDSSNLWCNSFTGTYNGVYLTTTASTTINDQLNFNGYVGAATGNQWFSTLSGKVSGTSSSLIRWYYNNTAGSSYDPNPPVGVTNINFVFADHDACSFQLAPEDPPIDPQQRLAGTGPKSFEGGNSQGSVYVNTASAISSANNERELEEAPSLEKYPNYLDSMGVEAADQYNAEIVTNSDADIARKQVDAIHLYSWARGFSEFTPPDSAYLCNLAMQDPAVYGDAVYSAMVMVGECGAQGEQIERKIQTHVATALSYTEKGIIYPNPNNGLMQASMLLKDHESGMLEIFDISGFNLASYKLKAGSNTFTIDESRLTAGVYICYFVINGKIVQTNKLVIVK